MKDERWTLVDRVLEAALERKPDQRTAFLDEACAGDEALRHEVESLLEHHTKAGEFLESPAVELLNPVPSAEIRAPFVDRQLGCYRILSLLGTGGMGEVYQARDTKLDRDVAIKVLRPDVLVDDDRRRRFIREARAASTLNHPNIVTIHDIQQAEGVDFIVMEYVRGKSLDQVIPDDGLPVDRALEYAAQIASAIADAHGAGVVHRDIKPANIVLSETGRLKVLDFGLAKLIDQVPGTSATNVTSTISGPTRAILGTPAYMSPEQARGVPVSAKSDVFSFGAVLYEMLAGRRPFAGPTPLDTLTKIVGEAPPPLNARRADVPAALVRLADACCRRIRTRVRPPARSSRASKPYSVDLGLLNCSGPNSSSRCRSSLSLWA